MMAHGSVHTDLRIDMCLVPFMSQFQVQGATGVYSSLFMKKISKKVFLLIYKKGAKEKPHFPQVYTGTSQTTKFKRENLRPWLSSSVG